MFRIKTSFIRTFGCQMNEADSEKITGWCERKGWRLVKDIYDADMVVINTCSVRQSAEDRVYGLINNLIKKSPATRHKSKIILTGCMLYHPIVYLKKKLPETVEFKRIEEFHSPSTIRQSPIHAWLPISQGCNHFCSYCVVPYARGRERSHPFEEIVCEVERLAERGYKEITLLGQNVNSYGKDFPQKEKKQLYSTYHRLVHDTPVTVFVLLLRKLHQIKGIKKISFMTSNPWDLTSDIIEAMALPRIDRYLHLPVQSGDNEILKKMNRHYTAKDYLKLVKKIGQAIPDIKIGTDIIVGFPGETEEQFQNTVELCKKVGFTKAYLAKYSPRPGTTAFKMKDNVSPAEKNRRWRILEELINKKSR